MQNKELKEKYQTISKELTAFVNAEIKEYQDQGIQINLQSHREQAKWIFLLGKIQALTESIKGESSEQRTENTKSTNTKKGKQKRTTGKGADSTQGTFGI